MSTLEGRREKKYYTEEKRETYEGWIDDWEKDFLPDVQIF